MPANTPENIKRIGTPDTPRTWQEGARLSNKAPPRNSIIKTAFGDFRVDSYKGASTTDEEGKPLPGGHNPELIQRKNALETRWNEDTMWHEYLPGWEVLLAKKR